VFVIYPFANILDLLPVVAQMQIAHGRGGKLSAFELGVHRMRVYS